MAARSRDAHQAVAEIGPLPAIQQPKRRDRCRRDLLKFLVTYFPQSAGLHPFSEDHDRFIARLQSTILEGGREIAAVYRGFAKTTIGELSILWSLLFGHCRFALLLGADRESAAQNLDNIKSELENNDLLAADFPEVCHPVRSLEGKAQRCRSQTLDGQLTGIRWTAKEIVFPCVRVTTPPPPAAVAAAPVAAASRRKRTGASPPVLPSSLSPSSAACIRTKGLLSCNRGLLHKLPDGSSCRPDFVFLDDPQTDASAASPAQCRARINKIYSTVLRLAGHRSRLALFVAGTVIQPDDVIDELLDRARHPSFRGERVPMLSAWSNDHETWMGEYARLRRDFDPRDHADRDRARDRANKFYRRHRRKMDAGAAVSWIHCYDPLTESSAIQHAYNIVIDDGPAVFAAECQQAPERPADISADRVPARDLLARSVGPGAAARGAAPQWSDLITVGIDCQSSILYWLAAAWSLESFTGCVIDWGTWPDQARDYFTLGQVRRTLAAQYPGSDGEGSVYAGLSSILATLAGWRFPRPDGQTAAVDLALVDSGAFTQTVYDASRAASLGSLLMPAKGRGLRATDRPISDWTLRPGNRRGREWLVGRSAARLLPLVTFDRNYWGTAVNEGLRIPVGSAGSLSIAGLPRIGPANLPAAGAEPGAEMLVDQLLAERGIPVSAAGRTVTEWSCPAGHDNHYADCLVMAAVAASVRGAQRPGQAPPRKPRSAARSAPVRYF